VLDVNRRMSREVKQSSKVSPCSVYLVRTEGRRPG
jgi:hypothetical protein